MEILDLLYIFYWDVIKYKFISYKSLKIKCVKNGDITILKVLEAGLIEIIDGYILDCELLIILICDGYLMTLDTEGT